MSTVDVITLPPDWNTMPAEDAPVPAGNYRVRINEVSMELDHRVRIECTIMGEGPCAGRRVFQNYVLTTPPGHRLFAELLEVIRVTPENGNSIPCSQLRGKVMDVTLKHNVREGKTYANIVEHRACNQA